MRAGEPGPNGQHRVAQLALFRVVPDCALDVLYLAPVWCEEAARGPILHALRVHEEVLVHGHCGISLRREGTGVPARFTVTHEKIRFHSHQLPPPSRVATNIRRVVVNGWIVRLLYVPDCQISQTAETL